MAWLLDRAVHLRIAGGFAVLWGTSAYVRCLDRINRRHLVAAAALVAAWMLDTIIKWRTTDARLSAHLWYAFYIPITVLPLICLLCALRASGLDRRPRVHGMCRILWALACALILLVMTNDLHEQVFRFAGSPRNDHGPYSYQWGYWTVAAWSVACYLAFFGVLLAHARRRLKPLLVPAIILAALGLAFCIAYGAQAPWAFSQNFSLVYAALVIASLELCLDLGFIASSRSFAWLFGSLPFDLKIIDRAGQVFRATSVAAPLDDDVRERLSTSGHDADARQAEASRPSGGRTFRLAGHPGKSFHAWQLSGATALLTQDARGLDALEDVLVRRRDELRRANEMLRQRQKVAAVLERLSARERLMDEVEGAVSASLQDVGSLLSDIASASAPCSPAWRERQLRLARMLLGYCKRKSSLALSESADPELDRDRVLLIASELAGDLRAVGIDAAAVASIPCALPAHEVSVLYDCIYGVARIAFDCERPVLMYFLGGRDDGLVELRASLESDDPDDLSKRPESAALLALLAERDVAYSLVGGAGSLRLIARVGRGGAPS